MAETIDADLEGEVSPPRDNGEIVFGAPWERRVFGVTIALCRSGRCDWEQFRRRLIACIAEDSAAALLGELGGRPRGRAGGNRDA